MAKKDVVAALDQIRFNISKNITNPNRGGCAVIAALVGKRLEQYTDVEVLVQDWYYGNASNLNEIKNNNDISNYSCDDWTCDHEVDFSHVLLKFLVGDEWIVFDSEGFYEYNPNNFCEGSLSVDDIRSPAADRHGWNDGFDRKQMLQIGRIVRDALPNIN